MTATGHCCWCVQVMRRRLQQRSSPCLQRHRQRQQHPHPRLSRQPAMQAAAGNRHLQQQQQHPRPHSQWIQMHRLLVPRLQPLLRANSRQPLQVVVRSRVLRLVQMLLLMLLPVFLPVQPQLLTAWTLISLLHNPMLLMPLRLSQLQQRGSLLSRQLRVVAMLQLQPPRHRQPQQRLSSRSSGSGSVSSSASRMLACRRLPRGLWLSHCRL